MSVLAVLWFFAFLNAPVSVPTSATASVPLSATVGPTDLAAAKASYDKARYEDVVQALRGADLQALPAPDRAQALFILGVSELALGREALSQKNFVQLLSLDPDFALPLYTAPKVVAAFERARVQAAALLVPKVEGDRVLLCEGIPKRATVKVTFVHGAGESAGAVDYEAPCFVARPDDAGEMHGYYVVVWLGGQVLASVGSRAAPLPFTAHELALAPVARAPTPWYKHWLTWTIAGVVVGGVAATTAIVLVNQKNAPGAIRVEVGVP